MKHLRSLVIVLLSSSLLLLVFTISIPHGSALGFPRLVSKQVDDSKCWGNAHPLLKILDRVSTQNQKCSTASQKNSVVIKLQHTGRKVLQISRSLFRRDHAAPDKTTTSKSLALRDLWASRVHKYIRSSQLKGYSHFLSDIGKGFLSIRQHFNAANTNSTSTNTSISSTTAIFSDATNEPTSATDTYTAYTSYYNTDSPSSATFISNTESTATNHSTMETASLTTSTTPSPSTPTSTSASTSTSSPTPTNSPSSPSPVVAEIILPCVIGGVTLIVIILLWAFKPEALCCCGNRKKKNGSNTGAKTATRHRRWHGDVERGVVYPGSLAAHRSGSVIR